MKMLPKIRIVSPVFSLPLFFVFHGYVDFFDLVTIPAGISILLDYWLIAILLLLLFRWVLRSWERSALFSFSLLSVEFFFGSFQDVIKKYFPSSFLDRYSFQLAFIAILLLVLFIFLRSSNHDLSRLTRFFNLLMPLLLIIDGATLGYKIMNRKEDPTVGNRAPLTKPIHNRPDIYFIITDGYSGYTALRDHFRYDNSRFENELRSRGFHVADSSFSNYNYTVFSVASTLNMDYLRADGYFNGKTDLPRAFKALRNNPTMKFFETQGYDIINNSIFDIYHHPTQLVRRLMKYDKSPLITQTLVYRIWNDLGYHLFTILGINSDVWEKTLNTDYNNNVLADSLTRTVTHRNKKSLAPFFVYTHLVMPHVPYYFDSTGNRFSNKELNEESQSNKDRYINYLAYTNKKILSLIDDIIRKNGREAIIILLGDHGCRDCLQHTPGEKAQSVNLNAVLLPNRNYQGFYKGMSSVNTLRLVFNNALDQHLPLIKDSAVTIKVNEALLH